VAYGKPAFFDTNYSLIAAFYLCLLPAALALPHRRLPGGAAVRGPMVTGVQ
jgi:hypothetical protein